MDIKNMDDHSIVDGILNNDKQVIEDFFSKKCSGLFSYIFSNVFDGQIDKRALISELYLCLAENDWQKIRIFQFRSSLMTYVSVVAVRFFIAKRDQLIETPSTTTLYEREEQIHNAILSVEQRIDIRWALNKMPNERYRKVIEMLDLKGIKPELLAEEMNVTVANLYNIHHRAQAQLRLVMGRKEDYV